MPWISRTELDELKGYAKVYGERLAEHHDSMGSCEEARQSWQARHGAQAARIAELGTLTAEQSARLTVLDDQIHEQALTIRGLVEENATLKAAAGAAQAPAESGATS